jgi:hypothetical protein
VSHETVLSLQTRGCVGTDEPATTAIADALQQT